MQINAGRDINFQEGKNSKIQIDNRSEKKSWQDNILIYFIISLVLIVIGAIVVNFLGVSDTTP